MSDLSERERRAARSHALQLVEWEKRNDPTFKELVAVRKQAEQRATEARDFMFAARKDVEDFILEFIPEELKERKIDNGQ